MKGERVTTVNLGPGGGWRVAHFTGAVCSHCEGKGQRFSTLWLTREESCPGCLGTGKEIRSCRCEECARTFRARKRLDMEAANGVVEF